MYNVIESYLVSLGFETDIPSFSKLKSLMVESERVVTQHSTGMAKQILEAQGAIVGAYTAVSAAIVGVADKAAMADQSYRLMGLRMMMTTAQARQMDIVTKALGVSLEEIVWDPELNQRAGMMLDHISKLEKMLGPGFEGDMRGIRDIRAEISLLGVDMQYLGMKFASDLFRKMNPGGEDIFSWLDRKIDELEQNLPELSEKLSDYAVPALKDTWSILKDIGGVVKEAGLAFTNMIGVLSGDDSVEGTEFDFDKLAKAIHDAGEEFKRFLKIVTGAEKSLADAFAGVSLASSGKWDEASKMFAAAKADFDVANNVNVSPLKTTDTSAADQNQHPVGWKDRLRNPLPGVSGEGNPSGAATRDSLLGKIVIGSPMDKYILNKDWWTHTVPLASPRMMADHLTGAPEEAKVPEVSPTEDKSWMGRLGHGFWDYFGFNSRSGTDRGPSRPIAAESAAPSDRQSAFDAVGEFIKKQEGWAPGSKSFRNNNPMNLVFANQAGATRSTDSIHDPATGKDYPFAKFETEQAGNRAMLNQIAIDAARNETILEFSKKIAPSVGAHADPRTPPDNPLLYAQKMAEALGLKPTDPLSAAARGNEAVSHDFAFGDQPTAAAPSDSGVPQASNIVPDWYGDKPEFMQHDPDWYSSAPVWMQTGGEQKSAADVTHPAMWKQPVVPDSGQDWRSTFAEMQRPATAVPAQIINAQRTITVDVGGISIMQPNLDEAAIHRIAKDSIEEALESQTQFDLANLQAQWG